MFLTSPDASMSRTVATRDPLGLQPIWTERARELVPSLTEQTTSARGFQLLTLAIWTWNLLVARQPAAKMHSITTWIPLVEQACARAWVRAQDNSGPAWSLPGLRRANHTRLDDHVAVSTDESHQLLSAPVATGTYGIYYGAAKRAGLLDSARSSLSGEMLADLKANSPMTPREVALLHDLLWPAVAKANHVVTLDVRPSAPLAAALVRVLSELPQRGIVARKVITQFPLTRSLAIRMLDPTRTAARSGHRTLLREVVGAEPRFAETIARALACEDYIDPLQGVFDRLGGFGGERVGAAAARVDIDLTALQAARARFAALGPWRRDGAARNAELYAGLDLTSGTALVKGLVGAHSQICRARRRGPWLEIDGDALVVRQDFGVENTAQPAVGLGWRHDYYLDPLRAVAADLRGEVLA